MLSLEIILFLQKEKTETSPILVLRDEALILSTDRETIGSKVSTSDSSRVESLDHSNSSFSLLSWAHGQSTDVGIVSKKKKRG